MGRDEKRRAREVMAIFKANYVNAPNRRDLAKAQSATFSTPGKDGETITEPVQHDGRWTGMKRTG